ncbi:hypothetical protein HYDPIDRAFT_112186 [Hydnomerulius pinastri MD-312]|uniref:Uncharacterized protein n=1 Tax=Hydnomerulius pinastri MD-312 TaxID=994086 RepID=A0A0C9W979_9AGAM|nr:hypothetical protein HYDPIDRAFT_112186 [Hydnomerulius pinastri MD-312]
MIRSKVCKLYNACRLSFPTSASVLLTFWLRKARFHYARRYHDLQRLFQFSMGLSLAYSIHRSHIAAWCEQSAYIDPAQHDGHR